MLAATVLVLCGVPLLAGCSTWPRWFSETVSPAAPTVAAGMNAAGQVVDSSKVKAGAGQAVAGIDGRVGEVTGQPAPSSAFVKLHIGMTLQQVVETLGPPSDQGVSTTVKAWLPWASSSDQYRYEVVYKSQGRLVFEGPEGGRWSGSRLVWIIHCATERGYR